MAADRVLQPGTEHQHTCQGTEYSSRCSCVHYIYMQLIGCLTKPRIETRRPRVMSRADAAVTQPKQPTTRLSQESTTPHPLATSASIPSPPAIRPARGLPPGEPCRPTVAAHDIVAHTRRRRRYRPLLRRRREHGGGGGAAAPAAVDDRARHDAGEVRPPRVAAPAPRPRRLRRPHPRRRPRLPRPRRRRLRRRRRLPHPRLLPGGEPWHRCGADHVGDGGGSRVLPAAGGGEGEALLRRPGQEDTAVDELQRAQGDGAQLARLSPPALLSSRPVRPRLALESALLQGDHRHVLHRGEGAGVQAIRGDIGEPWAGGRIHEGDAGGAGAAHGRELLPAVPGAGAHLWPPRAHRPQRSHHPPHGRPGRRPAGPQRRQVDRRQPAARCPRHQHRRPTSGAEQRGVQERVAPGGGELRQGEDVGGVVPVPVQQRGARPGQEAHHRRLAGGVPELHLRRVLQEVLEQEP